MTLIHDLFITAGLTSAQIEHIQYRGGSFSPAELADIKSAVQNSLDQMAQDGYRFYCVYTENDNGMIVLGLVFAQTVQASDELAHAIAGLSGLQSFTLAEFGVPTIGNPVDLCISAIQEASHEESTYLLKVRDGHAIAFRRLF